MKINKLILGAAALAMGGGAFAQSVAFHAGIDYTAWGFARSSYNDDGSATHTNPSAGYDPDGSRDSECSRDLRQEEHSLRQA